MLNKPSVGSDASMGVKRNDLFYSDSVVFKVEDELFKVPKEQFERRSEIFRDMFKLPTGQSRGFNNIASAEGTHDDNPIILEGVEKSAFIALLKVLYPRNAHDESFYAQESLLPTGSITMQLNLDLNQWLSVYTLASLWMMEDVLSLSITKVNLMVRKADPIQKVSLGREHRREDWLLEGYAAIISAEDDLSEPEAHGLGTDTVVKLQGVIIKRLQSCLKPHRRKRRPLNFKDPLDPNLEDVFRQELDHLRIDVALGQYRMFPESEPMKASRLAKADRKRRSVMDESDSDLDFRMRD